MLRLCMAMAVLLLFLCDIFPLQVVRPAVADDEAVVELSMEDIEDVGEGDSTGEKKDLFMAITGPTIWVLFALAILTRYVRIKGKAKLLMRLHKVLAYTAFSIATVHGAVGLFM